MAKFLAFVGNRAAYIHNARFEQAFFDNAEEKTGQVFGNKVYDTLVMAQMIWNDGGPHSINRLIKRLGLPQFQGRTLGEVNSITVSYTHLRAHETGRNLVCRLLWSTLEFEGFYARPLICGIYLRQH